MCREIHVLQRINLKNQDNTETNIKKDENKSAESDNTINLDEPNGSTTPTNQDKDGKTNTKKDADSLDAKKLETCMSDISKLIDIYNSDPSKLKLWNNKVKESNESAKQLEQKDHCIGTKFEEIYKKLKQQMHDISQEKQASKKKDMKNKKAQKQKYFYITISCMYFSRYLDCM